MKAKKNRVRKSVCELCGSARKRLTKTECCDRWICDNTEDYVWYGTNEYNFEKLPNPPKFKPTHCARCDHIINRGDDGYTSLPNSTFLCEQCGGDHMRDITQ